MAKRPPYNRAKATSDLVEQAKASLGAGADPVTVTDALFDAAFRALKRVPIEHPGRWPMVVGYWEKMCGLYEAISGGETGTDGLVVVKRPDRDAGPGKEPENRYTKGYNAGRPSGP